MKYIILMNFHMLGKKYHITNKLEDTMKMKKENLCNIHFNNFYKQKMNNINGILMGIYSKLINLLFDNILFNIIGKLKNLFIIIIGVYKLCNYDCIMYIFHYFYNTHFNKHHNMFHSNI